MKEFMNYDFDVSDITLACYVKPNQGRHKHVDRPSHGLALHLGGDKDYHFSDGRVVSVSENTVIYLPKGSTYYVKARSSGDCYAINFRISESICFEPFSVNVRAANDFLHYFKSAKKSWETKSSGYKMRCKAELYNIIAALQAEYHTSYIPKSRFAIIEPAVNYINENYTAELLSISHLAKMCNITPEYFRRIFRERFGDSPISYINNMKLSRSRDLLSSGMYSVSEAAELSGYSDFSHFSREFKRNVGVPPSEYQGISLDKSIAKGYNVKNITER